MDEMKILGLILNNKKQFKKTFDSLIIDICLTLDKHVIVYCDTSLIRSIL
jgi:hypothetical protein